MGMDLQSFVLTNLGNPIHQALPPGSQTQRNKPEMIKVEPKINLMVKTASEEVLDTDLLEGIEEEVDIVDEFTEDLNADNSLEKRIGSGESEPRNSYGRSDLCASDKIFQKQDSNERQDDDTNASGMKLSITSKEKDPRASSLSSTNKK